MYVQVALKRIERSKEMFALEIEEGTEVRIPALLSHDELPLSFQYYDPVIKLVQAHISAQKREFYSAKNKLAA